MNVLALCSGIGGLDLGVGGRVVCHVEREAYAAAVLAARMEEGRLDPAPIWDDLATFDGRPWRGVVDLVTAGFPCQPVSLAGKGLAQDDERWLWPHVERVVREARPGLVFLENVPGLVRRGLDGVLAGLAVLGFHTEWSVFSAAGSGAPHLRRRIFILAAHPERAELRNESRWGGGAGRTGAAEPRHDGAQGACARTSSRLAEPRVGRAGNGVPHRLDRLRALGNGVVPQVAARAWRVLGERMVSE